MRKKFIQNADGTFAGSIGDGKTHTPETPAPAPVPAALPDPAPAVDLAALHANLAPAALTAPTDDYVAHRMAAETAFTAIRDSLDTDPTALAIAAQGWAIARDTATAHQQPAAARMYADLITLAEDLTAAHRDDAHAWATAVETLEDRFAEISENYRKRTLDAWMYAGHTLEDAHTFMYPLDGEPR